MSIELTADQSRQLAAEGESAVVIDPMTHRQFRLVAAEPDEVAQQDAVPDISPEMRASREALWRDLPELLKVRRYRGRCVCYHGDRRIGVGAEIDLIRACQKLGLKRSDYYIGVVDEQEFIEVQEVDAYRPWLVDDDEDVQCPSS